MVEFDTGRQCNYMGPPSLFRSFVRGENIDVGVNIGQKTHCCEVEDTVNVRKCYYNEAEQTFLAFDILYY